jgi:hypothetical protein
MAKIRKWIIFGVAFLALVMINGGFYTALADHDEHKEKRWYQKMFARDDDDDHDDDHDRDGKRRRHQKRYRNNSKNYKKRHLTPVNNPTYIEECGACHFTYQPQLLPSGSWDKILAGLEDHFGEVIELDLASKKVIGEYLKTNAAEYSSAKRAVKIMKSLGSQTPLRITEVPYIQRKHHEVSPSVFSRDPIGSFSNCLACHTTAEKGIYDDDYVVIPP